MIYDVPPNVNNTAPVAANIVIRSKAQEIDPEALMKENRVKAAKTNYTSESAQRFDISKFTKKLEAITSLRSREQCAKFIRIALQYAGANVQGHPVAAADWGSTLKKIGYRQINPAFDNPQKGDIYIIDRTKKHTYGHIAGYSGSDWISDFRQNGHAVYRDPNVSYKYFRPE